MSTYEHRAIVTEPIDEAQWNAMTGQERRWYVRDKLDLFCTEDPYAMSFAEGMACLRRGLEADRAMRIQVAREVEAEMRGLLS